MAEETEPAPPRGDVLALAQQAMAHALGIAMQNAVASQQMMNMLTVAIAAQLGGARGEDQAAALRTTLEVLKAQDPIGQMAQLTDLLGRLQEMLKPPGTPPPVGSS